MRMAHLMVQAAQRGKVLGVSAPFVQRILQPEEIVETAETKVKTLDRHVQRQGLDLHVAGVLGKRQKRWFKRGGQRLIGWLIQVVQSQNAILLQCHADRFRAQIKPYFLLQQGIRRVCLLGLGQAEIEFCR